MREQLARLSGCLASRALFAAVSINLLLVTLFYLVIVNAVVINMKDDFVAAARVKSDLVARLLPAHPDTPETAAALTDIMLSGEIVYADYGPGTHLLAPGMKNPPPRFREDFRFGEHGDDIYFISVPLNAAEGPESLRLGFSEQGMQQNIDQIYRNGLYLSALYLLLLVPLSLMAAHSISRPIQALRNSAHLVASGEVSTPISQDTRIVELRELARDLEVMRSTLVAREAHYAAILDNAAEGILVLDEQGHIQTANLSAQRILGLESTTWTGMHLATALGMEAGSFSDHRGAFHIDGHRLITLHDDSGNAHSILNIAASSFVHSGKRVYVLLVQDITRHKELQNRLHFMAYHDLLTELPNRQLFVERLNEAIARSSRYASRLAVLFLDLDHFKVINDSLGHQYGDLLLQSVGRRLKQCVRETDVVARLGGDEFTILLSTIEEREDAGQVAEKIIHALTIPFDLKHYQHYIGVSIGISIYPDDGVDAESLIKQADTAMYQAKSGGRNRCHYYSEDMQRSAIRRLSLANNLRSALAGNELTIHYQPIVGTLEQDLAGAEALCRWNHKRRGYIPPSDFIPIAEETGIITNLGIWVLRRVAGDAAELLEHLPALRMNVNISAHQLYHREFFEVLDAIASDHPEIADHLVLEITETAAMIDIEGASQRLARLRDMGFGIALDDFGTGHSSLSYLRRLPVDVLKIDSSFIDEMAQSPHAAGIVRNIVTLASSLKLKSVAEGVEQEAQLEMLREIGCYAVQGYLFSAAIEKTAFVALAKQASIGGRLPTRPCSDGTG